MSDKVVCVACGHVFTHGEAIFNMPSMPKCFYCANIGVGNKVYENPSTTQQGVDDTERRGINS